VLIIGVGNADRSDDAAGLLVARWLRELGIDAREHTGDPLALIDAWDGASEAILIDTVVSGAAPGTITKWDAGETPLPPDQFCCSTHALGLAEAVEIARSLGRLPGRLMIYGIEGVSFEFGGAPSAEVAAAVERVAQEIAKIDLVGQPFWAASQPSGPRRVPAEVFSSNSAPSDDEPVTEEDRRRFQEGLTQFAEGGRKGVAMQDVLPESGLRPEDFPL